MGPLVVVIVSVVVNSAAPSTSQKCADDRVFAPGQTGSSDDDGSDHAEFVAFSRRRITHLEIGKLQEAGQAGTADSDHIDQHLGARDVHAAQPGSQFIRSDRTHGGQ